MKATLTYLFVIAMNMAIFGCSKTPPSSPSKVKTQEKSTQSESTTNIARLSAAPLPENLESLDPAAATIIRQAAEALDKAVYRPDLWLQMGVVYHAHRQFALAKTCYEQQLIRDDKSARSWYYLSLIEDQLGHPKKAVQAIKQSIALDSGYPPAHWRLGLWMLDVGDLAVAERSMQTALSIAPRDAASVVGLARVHLQQDRVEDAISGLEQHLKRLPQDGNARFLLGTAYRKAGRLDDANKAFASGSGGDPIQDDPWRDEVIAYRKGYRTEFNQAMAMLREGHTEEAIALFESLHERQPNDTLIHINLHRAYRIQGQLERAIALLLEAEKIRPLSDMIQVHLAGAFLDQARQSVKPLNQSSLETALLHAEKACALSPTYAVAHGLHGDILQELKRGQEATEAYIRATNYDHNSIMWHGKAGLALCQLQRWKEAIPILRRIEALQPDNAQMLFLLSAALANSGQLDEALSPLGRAKQLAPNDAKILKAWDDLAASLRTRDSTATSSGMSNP